jgi:purine-binding chemotaxis protein CheW
MIAAEGRQGVRLGLMSTGAITVGIDVTCVAEVCPVRTVSRLLATAPGLLGAIDLRGNPIPLFDPLRLAGLEPARAEPQIGLIATKGGRRIALGFDAIEGLIQVPRDRVERHESTEGAFFAGTLENGGRIVSLLEPRALLSRSDIPTATVVAAGARRVVSGAISYLTFESGGARFGIEATGVEATVPRQAIEPEALADGAWLGIIRHHGRRVPVMHLNAVLGIGAIPDLRTAEVVIVRFPDSRRVGFAVETIRRMRLVSLEAARPVPPLLAARALGLQGIVPDTAECDTFLVDLAGLRADPALRGIAVLSDEEPPPATRRSGPVDAAAEDAGTERDRYLVARAGAPVAIPIGQIARIVTMPEEVIPLARAPAWVRGIFRQDEATVPLIDLGQRLGHGPTAETERTRVLLTGARDDLLGFTVESVDQLEWSEWRSARPTGDAIVTSIVSLPRLGAQGVVPVVDLARYDAAAPAGPSNHG